MDKAITTALFIVVSMILVIMLFNAVYPAIQQGSDSIASMAYNVSDRMRHEFSVVHASAELPDGVLWQDSNGNGLFDVLTWVKNTGNVTIPAIDRVDVFFGREGNYTRIPYQVDGSTPYPNWTSNVENDTVWVPTATLQIAIHYQVALATGRYYLKVTLPNGMSSDYFLGI
jgi:archaellum component FlaG (FlaF/FlaG flagellin family)